MVAWRAIFIVLLGALAAGISEKLNPLSDEFIDLINSKQNSWKAGRNFPVDTPYSYLKNLMGVLPGENFAKLPNLKKKHNAELIANLPESFDPRDKWPNCPSLNEIRDQGACGSCWVFGVVEAMTDRYCIYSNGSKQFHFSAQEPLSCGAISGCHGGMPMMVWEYWIERGIVSGGNYNSNEGCQPYKIAGCEHHVPGKLPPCGERVDSPECVKSCEPSYNTEYDKDKRHGKVWYGVDSNEEDIKAELFKNGPVQVVFDVYDDFFNYKQGVYKHTSGRRVAGHAVKMLGWGVENSQKYWLIANSWNSEWGDKGYFKIIRGENHCGIEKEVTGGVPLIE